MTDLPPQPVPEAHLISVVGSLLAGRMIPFLGAGANLIGAGENSWNPADPARLPSGKELSVYIADKFGYRRKEADDLKMDLAKVCQYAATLQGRGPLDAELHPLFDGLFPATSLHQFLARLPALRQRAGYPRTSDPAHKRFLVVTTNYDDVMERAFREANQKFHVLTYLASQDKPAFLHQPPDDSSEVITIGTGYTRLDSDTNPVVLKVHGSIDREKFTPAKGENFVITEDDYIDYLSWGDIASALPKALYGQLTVSNFLFLGYALQDWNLRAFLKRIWREQQKKNFNSWAVMADCSEFEQQYWARNGVSVLNTDLQGYVEALAYQFDSEIDRNLKLT